MYVGHVALTGNRSQIEDINSELDELDREEFYRLKKVIVPSREVVPVHLGRVLTNYEGFK